MENRLLNKMASETFGQMIENDDIASNFSSKLQQKILKIGTGVLLVALAVASSGVQASDKVRARNATLAVSAVVGMALSGSKSENVATNCDVRSKSGAKVGGSAALGGLIGNQIGGGSGNILATVAGAVIGGMAANSSENNRMMEECANNIRYRTDHHGIPSYATNKKNVQSPILYEGRTVSGKSFIVAAQDSPGIAGLSGRVVGQINVDGDPIVQKALDEGSHALKLAYEALDANARTFHQVAQGGTTIGKLSRYAVTERDIASNSPLSIEYSKSLNEAKQAYDQSYEIYSLSRSLFARVADNAVVDGYNITPYREALNYFTPPESATVTYNGRRENRYAVIKSPAKPQ